MAVSLFLLQNRKGELARFEPSTIGEKLLSITPNKKILLLLINGILLVAGCFIDAAWAYYIFLPILLPVIRQRGVDPIFFGVFMTMNLAIGMTTPPVALVTFIPTLSLWLPDLMGIK